MGRNSLEEDMPVELMNWHHRPLLVQTLPGLTLAAGQITQECALYALAPRGGLFFKILISQYDSYL